MLNVRLGSLLEASQLILSIVVANVQSIILRTHFWSVKIKIHFLDWTFQLSDVWRSKQGSEVDRVCLVGKMVISLKKARALFRQDCICTLNFQWV